MIFDVHTHQLPLCSGTAIVNCSFPETFVPSKGEYYSVGIHPWSLSDGVKEEEWARLEHLLSHPQVLAVGEAGLDRLVSVPFSQQTAVFYRQASLAETVHKPLIIHLVRAADELLRIYKKISPRQPWIIHGFRGKAQQAMQLLRHGFFLSFGERYQEDALRLTPVDKLFIETDESSVPIEELYVRAACVRNISPEALKETVCRNAETVFLPLR